MVNLDDFRSFLIREFSRRQKRNPSYSLSAFARDLAMSPQKLGQVINGRSGLSPDAANKISGELNLTGTEHELFIALVEARHARSARLRRLALDRVSSLRQIPIPYTHLAEKEFALLPEWHYWAVYLAVELRDFISQPDWIARRLRLPVETCLAACEALFQNKLVQKTDNGVWRQTQKKFSFAATTSTAEVRNLYRQILKRAEAAIDGVSPDERHFNVSMLPIRAHDYDDIKARIDDAIMKILDDYATIKEPMDRVYAISTSFFPLDQKENP